jgi:hypothetical protein
MDMKKLNWQAFPIGLIVAIIYVVVGVLTGKWHPTWLIFFAIPLYHWAVDVIKNKRIKGLPTFVAVVVSLTVFLAVGFSLQKWHPAWLVFFVIPLTSALEFFFSGGVKGQVKKASVNLKKNIMGDNSSDADIE